MPEKETIFYQFKCETGCGHMTITNKIYKSKRIHCAVCGSQDTMQYRGKVTVEPIPFTIRVAGLGDI